MHRTSVTLVIPQIRHEGRALTSGRSKVTLKVDPTSDHQSPKFTEESLTNLQTKIDKRRAQIKSATASNPDLTKQYLTQLDASLFEAIALTRTALSQPGIKNRLFQPALLPSALNSLKASLLLDKDHSASSISSASTSPAASPAAIKPPAFTPSDLDSSIFGLLTFSLNRILPTAIPCTRVGVETFLESKEDGDFIIRQSMTQTNTLVLSCIYKNTITHFSFACAFNVDPLLPDGPIQLEATRVAVDRFLENSRSRQAHIPALTLARLRATPQESDV